MLIVLAFNVAALVLAFCMATLVLACDVLAIVRAAPDSAGLLQILCQLLVRFVEALNHPFYVFVTGFAAGVQCFVQASLQFLEPLGHLFEHCCNLLRAFLAVAAELGANLSCHDLVFLAQALHELVRIGQMPFRLRAKRTECASPFLRRDRELVRQGLHILSEGGHLHVSRKFKA
ncbi:MAG TPA: hypothetical protein VHC19_12495 [Pirellulales bacterium]|nr:hypothetical protein [Pirellulales bacterium]